MQMISEANATTADHAVALHRNQIFSLFSIVFCVLFIISNILASKTLDFCGIGLSASIVLFPIMYSINSCLVEIFGMSGVKRVLVYGFCALCGATLFIYLATLLPASQPQVSAAFSQLYSTAWRILGASIVSYWAAGMSNALIMKWMKANHPQALFARCFVSSIASEIIDAVLFMSIALGGAMDTATLLIAILVESAISIVYQTAIYPLTRRVILSSQHAIAAEAAEQPADKAEACEKETLSERRASYLAWSGLHEMASFSTRKANVYDLLTALFCCALVVSNVIAAKSVSTEHLSFAASVILYPVVYIVDDAMSEVFGFKLARRCIMMGFVSTAVATAFFQIAAAMPGIDASQADAFQTIMGNSWRILVGMYLSYLAGSLLNAQIMVTMKAKLHRWLFLRCVFSTIVGQLVDSTIFISVAFFGLMDASLLLATIFGQAGLKIVYEIVVYPLTRTIIMRLRKL